MDDNKYFLGQLLQKNDILYKTKITAADFITEFEVRTYNAIVSIFKTGGIADIVSVSAQDKNIDPYKLSTLTTDTLTATWRQVEARIRRTSKYRKLQAIAEMIQAANEYDDSLVSNIMLELERLDMVNEYEIVNARDYAETALAIIEERYKKNGQLPGITTGLGKLDDVMLGFEDRKLYVIGARPSQGKTALLLNFADRCNVDCGFISAESGKQELMNRIFSINGRIHTQRLTSGSMSTSDFSRLTDAMVAVTQRNMYIYDEPNMGIDTVILKAREMKRRFDIKILYIDYLQCIRGDQRKRVHEQVADISKALKALARSLDIPVVVSAQLRRDSEGNRPLLSDFSDSTQIERDADVAVMIFNYRDPKNKDADVKTYLLVEKNRDGRTGDLRVVFNKQYLRFETFQGGDE